MRGTEMSNPMTQTPANTGTMMVKRSGGQL